MKLLIVDDEYYFRKALIHSIPREEFGITDYLEAGNGEEAMQKIEEVHPDIIFADINMPRMNGLTLIENIKRTDPSIRVVIISGYDNFHYAKKGLQYGVDRYLLKPVEEEELFDTLSCLIQDIKNEKLEKLHRNKLELRAMKNEYIEKQYFLHKLLSISSRDGMAQALTEFNSLGFTVEDRTNFLVLVVRVKKEKNCERGKMIVMNVLTEQTARNFDSLVCVDDNGLVVILIMNITVERIRLLSNEIRHCQQLFYEKYQLITWAGIGNMRDHVWEIRESYKEAVKTVIEKHHLAESKFVMYGYYEEPKYYISEKDKKGLSFAVLEQNSLLAEEILDLIFVKLEATDTSFNSSKSSVWEIVLLLKKIQEQDCLQFNEHTKKELAFLRNLIHNTSPYLEMKKCLYCITTVLCESAVEKKKSCPDAVTKMLDLIQQRFSDPGLSVEMLSKELFMNYNYLCVLFKRHTGQTINDYITNFRMQKALEYIRQGVTRVSELAEKTGFANEGYFTKCFKKEYGIPPSRYISGYSREKNINK